MDELDLLKQKIRDRMNDLADIVATGGCKTYDQYQRLCGLIEGLATAERELLDIKDTRPE